MMVIGIGSSWAQSDETLDFTKMGYENAQTVSKVEGTDVTITFDNSNNKNNEPKYYDVGTAIRTYGGNTFQFDSEKTILKIVFDFSQFSNSYSVSEGSWDGESTWTGNASSVKFTVGGKSGHNRIKAITITYEDDDDQKIGTTVTYTGSATNEVVFGDEFTPARFVVDAADGTALIDAKLTYESSNPDVAEVDEAGNVTINGAGTAVITATYAGDDNYYGGHASYTLTVTNPDAVPVASLEEAFEAATATAQDIYFDFTGLQITAVTETNAYLQDANGFGAMIYNKAGHGYQVGQVLNGTANCQFVLYRGALEFMEVTSETVPAETPEMQEVHQFYVTVGDLAAYNHGSFIKLENMTYTGQTASGKYINYNFTDPTGAAFILYNTFNIEMPELTEGATYTLNGIFVVFNETHEIAPRNADDIVINKQYPTYNVSGLESVTTNGEFPFNVETRASGLKVELEKTELAELIPGTVVGEYTLKTYGSEGDIILNISTEEDATYYPNEEPYNVHISFSQGGEEPQFEIADGVFDFTAGVDYGSKCPEGNSNSIKTDEYTWIAGNVTLVTGGRHIWDAKSELKLYKSTTSQPTAGFVTLSVPQGYVITKVAFTFGQKQNLAEQDGLDTKTGIWTGISQSVTIETGTDRTDIDKIEVTYKEGTVPVELQDAIINVDGITDGQVAQAGETLSFTVSTRSSGLNVSIDNEQAAQLHPGTTIYDYTLNTTNAGTVVVTITTDADNTYKAGTKTITITVVDATEPQFEIQDGVFDFTAGVDYGSKCPEGNSNSIKTDEYTWIAGNVTLVTGGRHIWDAKSELKLYKSTTSQPTAGFVTLSVPQGYVITKVAFTFGQKQNLAEQDGLDTKTGIWTGISQSVTIETGTDRTDIDKIEVTYKEGTVPVEPTEVTINVMNEDGTPMDEKIVMNVGETKNFMVSASNQAHVSYRGDNDEVATVEPAVTFDGGIITAKAAGTMTITFNVDATSNQPSAEKKISVTVVDNTEPQFEIEDGVFDFTAGVDYGSGIKTTSDGGHYEEAPSTWTAGNITLVADGKYRWWERDATLRFYDGSSMTFSAPAGYAITSIKSNVTLTGFTATDGELSGNTWTGEANVVTLNKTTTGSVNISNITVQYKKADTYTRDVAKGEYGTLCLPYKSYVSGATVYDIVGVVKDGDKLTDLGLEEHTGALEAGVAYVFHATSTQVVATLVGEAVKETAKTVGLVGNLSAENIKTPDGCYVLVDGVLRQVQGGTAYIQTNRAYFDLSGVEAIEGEATAGVKYISISFEEDATGITELTEKTEATEGAIYNLQGQRVNSLQRGINIVGGKKVLVK